MLTCRWNASGGCKTSEFVEVSDHIVVHNDSGQQVTSWHSLTAIAVHSFSRYSYVRAFFCNTFFCVFRCVGVYWYNRPFEVLSVKKHQTYEDPHVCPRTLCCPRKVDLGLIRITAHRSRSAVSSHGVCVCELARLSNRGHYRLNTPNDRGPEVQSEDFARSSLFGPHIHITYGIQNAHKAGPRFGKVECV